MKKQTFASNAGSVGIQSFLVLLILTGVTIITLILREIGVAETNVVVVYVLSVLLVARFTKGYVYGIAASVLAIISYNFFFTEPYHTLNVYHMSDVITIAVLLAASFLTSTLTSKLLLATRLAKEREEQTNILFQITSSLAKASGVTDVAAASVLCLSNLLNTEVICITPSENEGKILFRASLGSGNVSIRDIGKEKIDVYTDNKEVIPIGDQSNRYGVICIPAISVKENPERRKLLPAIAMQIQIAMDRERLSEEKKRANTEMEREKFRSNLLCAISHDLRTPLAGISGTAEVLTYSLKEDADKNLAHGIYEEATWLTQMVENILSLTKLDDGKFILKKQPEAVEEIVGEAVKHIRKTAGLRDLIVEIPEDILIVPMDAKLILQVLINLLDNAVKHTRHDGCIRIKVTSNKQEVWFQVSDNGTGIKQTDLPYVFEAFFSKETRKEDARKGIGLGLSIARAIVKAHGGRIFAENNPDHGATIRFSLPMKESGHDEE